jgi:hypothetical protein
MAKYIHTNDEAHVLAQYKIWELYEYLDSEVRMELLVYTIERMTSEERTLFNAYMERQNAN